MNVVADRAGFLTLGIGEWQESWWWGKALNQIESDRSHHRLMETYDESVEFGPYARWVMGLSDDDLASLTPQVVAAKMVARRRDEFDLSTDLSDYSIRRQLDLVRYASVGIEATDDPAMLWCRKPWLCTPLPPVEERAKADWGLSCLAREGTDGLWHVYHSMAGCLCDCEVTITDAEPKYIDAVPVDLRCLSKRTAFRWPRVPTSSASGRLWGKLTDGDIWICDLCLADFASVIDHDHYTGIVRGLLCRTCNNILDLCDDDDGACAKRRYIDAPPMAHLGVMYPGGRKKTWNTRSFQRLVRVVQRHETFAHLREPLDLLVDQWVASG